MMPTLAQVALGGAIGASGRYLAGVALTHLLGRGFPWGTLAVNALGSFLMGVLVVALAHLGGTRYAPFLTVGVLGGFTTFSTFSLDTVALYERGETGLAAAYVAASLVLSVGGLLAGLALARALAS